jgi:hypothetical protein
VDHSFNGLRKSTTIDTLKIDDQWDGSVAKLAL